MAVSRGWANRPCRNSGLAVPSSRIYFEGSVLGLDTNSFPTDVDERVANAWIWKRFSIWFDFLLAFSGLINFPNRFVIAGPASVLLLRFVSPLIHFSPGECLCYVIVIVAGMVLKQPFGSLSRRLIYWLVLRIHTWLTASATTYLFFWQSQLRQCDVILWLESKEVDDVSGCIR